MRRLGPALDSLEDPAIEKIADDQKADPFQVLIATLLSAQTKDAVTLEASTRLFRRASTPRALRDLSVADIERLIYPVSFYRTKAKHVKNTCRLLLDRYDGHVPDTMEALVSLPGVGRKTANLVLIVALHSQSNICVDTHVHRIANRLGWVETTTAERTELALYEVVPRRWWPLINRYLVTWGQNVCRPVYPRCARCGIRTLCPRLGVTRTGR
jgi:endonuclease III